MFLFVFLIVILQQLGVQGKGFEPAVEALFGKNGFFPDTVFKTLYWTLDKLPGYASADVKEDFKVFNFSFFGGR